MSKKMKEHRREMANFNTSSLLILLSLWTIAVANEDGKIKRITRENHFTAQYGVNYRFTSCIRILTLQWCLFHALEWYITAATSN